MSNSSSLLRILFLHVLVLITLVQGHTSKTTWIGGFGATDWHTAMNWDNGIPSAGDSVIITGGNINSLNIVLISDGAEAFHITVGDYSELSIFDTLNVVGGPGNAIKIEKEGSIFNFNSLNVSQSTVALFILGDFENDGHLSIESCSNGIFNHGNANFVNKNLINIYSISRYGIENFSSFVNNGTLTIERIGFNGTAIRNFATDLQTIGHFENTATVFMKDIEGNAIVNWNITTFLNSGTVWAQDILLAGLSIRHGSKFTITQSGTLVLKSIGTERLNISNGGEFEVADGGFVNIIN